MHVYALTRSNPPPPESYRMVYKMLTFQRSNVFYYLQTADFKGLFIVEHPLAHPWQPFIERKEKDCQKARTRYRPLKMNIPIAITSCQSIAITPIQEPFQCDRLQTHRNRPMQSYIQKSTGAKPRCLFLAELPQGLKHIVHIVQKTP